MTEKPGGLQIKQEVVQDRGIWAVKYTVLDRSIYRVHTELDLDKVAASVYNHVIDFYPARSNIGKTRFGSFMHLREAGQYAGLSCVIVESCGHFARFLAEEFRRFDAEAGTYDGADTIGLDFSNNEGGLRLIFEKQIDRLSFLDLGDRDIQNIIAPPNTAFLSYQFLSPVCQRNPTPREVKMLNELSIPAPKE